MGQVTIRSWNQNRPGAQGLSRVSPALGAEDFWLTAARNVLKLVVKSEWRSHSIQAEKKEAPGKYCGYLQSPTHLSSHPPIHPFIHSLFIHISVYYPHPSVRPPPLPANSSIHLPTHLSSHLSTYLSIYPPTHPHNPPISHLPTHPPISPLIFSLSMYSFTCFLSSTLPIHRSTPSPSYVSFHIPHLST